MFIKNILTIWKKEVKGYFYTPIAYVFIGAFTLLMGVMFFAFLNAYFDYAQKAQFGATSELTIDYLAEHFYAQMHVILLIVLPFFTFSLLTEEMRRNTFVLLMTSPIRSIEITLAKFCSGLTMLAFMLGLTLMFPVFLTLYSADGAVNGPDPGIIFSTYLALFLAGALYISMGLFWSSVSESPLVALVLTFASNFSLLLISMLAQGGGEGWGYSVLSHLTVTPHFNELFKGSLDLKAIVYFLSFITLWLFFTNRSLESRSWRS